MIGRKSVISIAVLCALAPSAIGAASASAEQRAFTCGAAPAVEEEFADSHCKEFDFHHKVGYQDVEIGNGEAKAITGTNANTATETTAAAKALLAGTLAGVETEVQCTTVSGTGSLTNSASSVSGTGTIVYSGCSVAKPAGQGCVVTGGSITTETLAATTVSQTTGNVKFSPKSGTKFAAIPISGCSTSALNNTFPVTGSLIAAATGATLNTTEEGVTTQNTLKFGGNKAGLAGSLTVKVGSNGVDLT